MARTAHHLRVPREDVNDDRVTLVRWLVVDGTQVTNGQPVCLLETTKTIFEVRATADGPLHQVGKEGEDLSINALLATIGEIDDSAPTSLEAAAVGQLQLTRKAAEFAQAHNLDLSQIKQPGIVTLEDLQRLVRPAKAPHHLPPSGLPRILVLGAGVAAMQVLDILLNQPQVQVIGCLDDAPSAQGATPFGVPVLGTMALLPELWNQGRFDKAIVGVGTNLKVRRLFFERCKELAIPLANAIDPSARLNRHVVLGEGVVLCSFVHIGVNTMLGDNCFVAAHSNIDHHCVIGDHVLMGPGCLFSGGVTVGSRTLLGSGVVIQPTLTLGEDCLVASGSVILRDVPARSAVKVHAHTEIVSLDKA